MTACPDRQLALHAYLDGELDALGVADFEAHLATCAGCREELAQAEAVREALRAEPRTTAPAALRDRIEALAPPETPGRSISWGSFAGGGAVGALAASLALLLALPQMSAPALPDELVASHVRSLQADHLVDIATSNRHVVKPWFNGRIDFAPPVPDLAAQGYPLAGGRLDVIGGHSVAAIVYRRNLHSINLFVSPTATTSEPATIRRDSYALVHWSANGLEYWAVSDVEPADLEQFARDYRAAAGGAQH